MGREAAVTGDSLVGVHVLVVDNPDAGRLFRTILEYAGAFVTVAETAEQALRLVDHAVPHVLITDISMPGHDEWWLIRQVRARSPREGSRVPAIALTARAHDELKISAAGFQACLRKPIDPWELCRLVESLVRQGPRGSSAKA